MNQQVNRMAPYVRFCFCLNGDWRIHALMIGQLVSYGVLTPQNVIMPICCFYVSLSYISWHCLLAGCQEVMNSPFSPCFSLSLPSLPSPQMVQVTGTHTLCMTLLPCWNGPCLNKRHSPGKSTLQLSVNTALQLTHSATPGSGLILLRLLHKQLSRTMLQSVQNYILCLDGEAAEMSHITKLLENVRQSCLRVIVTAI